MAKDDPGFYAGIIYACGYLAEEGHDTIAEDIFSTCGMSHEDIKLCAEYDIAKLRRIIPNLPKGIN